MPKPTSKPRLRLLMVDDHAVLLDSMCRIFEADEAFEVVGAAGTVEAACVVARDRTPDVVLLDIDLGAESGLDGIGRLREACPKARIVMLSMCEQAFYRDRSFELGADAYVTKGARFEILRSILLDGKAAVGSDHAWVREGDGASVRNALTARELQVVHALAEGRREKEVADELAIAVSSVSTYLKRAMCKTGASSRAELMRHATALGRATREDS
jgi:DNA-binding NarL/FixJ family response regulator